MSLHYVEKGSGEPLVLLHGNGQDYTYFNNQIDFFSEYYRVIAVDTRGHGQSPRGDAPFTLSQFADDLKEFLDELGLSSVNLLGFSDGGNIAIVFALKYQEYLKKLVLYGANIFPKGLNSIYLAFVTMGYGIVSVFSSFSKRCLRRKELLALMVNEPNVRPGELGNITVPTLVIAGTQDLIRQEHTELIYQNLPNAECCYIEGTHFISANASEEFNERVLQFLRKE